MIRTWGLGDLVDTAALLVSELATNAQKASEPAGRQTAHGGSADRRERIALRLTCTDTNLVIEMWDGSEGKPVRTSRDLLAQSGRGLLLVTTLSCDWGDYRARTGGKVVWCALTLAGSAFSPVAGSPCPPPRVLDRLRALDDWHLPATDRSFDDVQ
jgi:hypothetical protein